MRDKYLDNISANYYLLVHDKSLEIPNKSSITLKFSLSRLSHVKSIGSNYFFLIFLCL